MKGEKKEQHPGRNAAHSSSKGKVWQGILKRFTVEVTRRIATCFFLWEKIDYGVKAVGLFCEKSDEVTVCLTTHKFLEDSCIWLGRGDCPVSPSTLIFLLFSRPLPGVVFLTGKVSKANFSVRYPCATAPVCSLCGVRVGFEPTTTGSKSEVCLSITTAKFFPGKLFVRGNSK